MKNRSTGIFFDLAFCFLALATLVVPTVYLVIEARKAQQKDARLEQILDSANNVITTLSR